MIREIQSDYRRYRQYGAHPIVIVFLTQGFWALFQYRVAHKIYKSKFPAFSKIVCGGCTESGFKDANKSNTAHTRNLG